MQMRAGSSTCTKLVLARILSIRKLISRRTRLETDIQLHKTVSKLSTPTGIAQDEYSAMGIRWKMGNTSGASSREDKKFKNTMLAVFIKI